MKEEVRNKLFEFILDMSFKDATNRMALPMNKGLKKDKDGEIKFQKYKGKIKSALKPHIDAYLNIILTEGIKEDDETVYKFINDVLGAAKGVAGWDQYLGKEFTFGNAQKVVNMAAKYLFLACYSDESLRDQFKGCHCPMDSIMIKGIIMERQKRNAKTPGLSASTSWSKLTGEKPEAYVTFQEIVKAECSDGIKPLEYDYLHWAEFADSI